MAYSTNIDGYTLNIFFYVAKQLESPFFYLATLFMNLLCSPFNNFILIYKS
jgi:hypothetical protein